MTMWVDIITIIVCMSLSGVGMGCVKFGVNQIVLGLIFEALKVRWYSKCVVFFIIQSYSRWVLIEQGKILV